MKSTPETQMHLRRYIQSEMVAYSSYEASLSDQDKARFRLGRRKVWLRRTPKLVSFLDEQNLPVPEDFCRPYGIPVVDRISSSIPLKYQFRAYNILREYARISVAAPELLASNSTPTSALDPSSGGCGVYEVLRHFGHKVSCHDYFEPGATVRFGKAYQRIHDDIGAVVSHFDGQSRPYPFADNSYDYIFCFQALDAYAHEDHWADAVNDLVRVASKAVILVFNPPPRNKAGLTDAIYRMLLGLNSQALTTRSFTCPDTNLPGVRLDKH